MLARCARCQGTFSTDRYGRQVCPHCGAELVLPAPPGSPEEVAPPRPPEPPRPAAPPPRPPSGVGPPGGSGPPAWPPPQGGGWGPPPDGPGLPSPFADRARLGFFAAFLETWKLEFADRARLGFFAAFLETWKLVATQPERFFARVRTDQAWTAIAFGVIASTVGNAFASLYAYLSGQQAILAMQQVMEKLPEEQARFVKLYAQALTGGALVAQVLLAPVLTFVLIYVGAAVVHLVLLLLRGGQRGFDATLTAVAYVSGLSLLLAVPACGSLLAGVWAVVALIIGLGAIQRCGSGKAAAAVLAPVALACVCSCGLVGASVSAILKGAASGAKGTVDL